MPLRLISPAMAIVLLTLLLIFYAPCAADKKGWDTDVCVQLPTSQNDLTHKRPYLPQQFSVRVEANIVDKNYTTDIREWYDETDNRGSLEQYDSGVKVYGFYDYNINQLVVVTPLQNSNFGCQVTDLSKDPNRFIFGSKTSPNGTDRMYTAAGALRFGGSQPEKYLGVQTVRGIQCDEWSSCLYWQDMDATMTVHWYFSRTDWLTSQELPQVPVRCVVKGRIWNNGVPANFSHIYEFSEYRDGLDGETKRFETPEGAYCQGMKTRLKPPALPKSFSFGAEVQTPETKSMFYVKESYDQGTKLVRMDYQPNGFGQVEQVKIHDFNTGLAYNINPKSNNCSVTLIQESGFDSDTQGLYAKMRSSAEFFFTNSTSLIDYEGMRTVRGIECDVWIANKNDWPEGNPVNTTWEWYFAKQEWQPNAGYSFESQMPVGIIISMHTEPPFHYHYSIYDYDESAPYIWNYDISMCYSSGHKHFFKMLLKGNFTADVLSDETLFISYIVDAVVKQTSVSPLRIQETDLDHSDKYIKVTFTMLDVAPFVGDVKNFPQQTSLAAAVNSLSQALNSGTLVISIEPSAKMGPIKLTAIPFSADLWGYKMMTIAPLVTSQPDDETVDDEEQEVFPDSGLPTEEEDVAEPEGRVYKRSAEQQGLGQSALEFCQNPRGYSSGSLAGIAIGMLILGFFICFGAILLGSKYGSFTSRSQGYEMT